MFSDRGTRGLVFSLFLVSGAAGLMLEVTWTRILCTLFGNTVFAASAVLTAFMLGLALGSTALGRYADRHPRPLRLYGLLEIGVGMYALLFPWLKVSITPFYRWFFQAMDPGFLLLSAVRFLFALLLILPPTFLMGGTLPVLGRFLGARREEAGQEVGYLYAVNTIGAVLGSFLSGFVMLEGLGVRGSLWMAGAFALAIGLTAFSLGSREAERKDRKKGKASTPPAPAVVSGETLASPLFYLVLVAFGVAGFCALAYEVIWTRILIFILTTSLYAFASMLTVFLAGLGLGGLFASRFVVSRLRRPLLAFGLVEILAGLSAMVSILMIGKLSDIDTRIAGWLQFTGSLSRHVIFTHFADAIVVLFLPTLVMGMAFPIVSTLILRHEILLGRRVGQIYAANTIGCVLGAFCGGLVLIPLLGLYHSLLALVSLNLLVGLVLVFRSEIQSQLARRALAFTLLGGFVLYGFFLPSDIFQDTIKAYHNPSETIFLREHATGTVVVYQFPYGERLIVVDGVSVAGMDFMLRSTQKLQGYIPLALHPRPRHVVQIGFGSGETTRVGLGFGVDDYSIVEICPAVFEAGPQFEAVNQGSYRDPRLRKIIMDGKNFALLSDEKFDIVMNDSIYPGSGGSSALYTYDHFRQCRERLADGGLFSCWVPIDLRLGELRMILKSFQSVFPHTTFWIASNCLNKHALILGPLEPLQVDLPRLAAVLDRPEIKEDLDAIAIHNIYDLLDCLVLDEDGVRRFVGDSPLNTDDRPRLEISCAVRGDWEKYLALVLAQITLYRAPVLPYISSFIDEPKDREDIAHRFEATIHIFRAQVAQLLRSPKERRKEMDLALAAHPGDVRVASCEAELEREIHDFQVAMEYMPSHSVLAQRLADKYFVALRYPEAENLYKQLLARRPPPPDDAYVHLAEIYYNDAKVTEAKRVLHECLEFWPDSAEAHDRLAGIYLKAGDRTQARFHIEEAVRLAPDMPTYQLHRNAILGR